MSAGLLIDRNDLVQSEVVEPVHPLGTEAKVLLTSVFGPFAQDDEYGSRTANPMELYHNQVTRVQGPFSLRMFHRSLGLLLIQANLDAPCTVLDYPSLQRFIEELRAQQYDIIGISAIVPNVIKAEKMCTLIRQYQPQATIVIGGHIANMPGLDERLDADHIVRGDGVRWFRSYLGQDVEEPIRHPIVESGIGARTMGTKFPDGPGDIAAALIPSAGCPMGCNFCSTSAMFGGKGKFVNFYRTGAELFDVMCEIERALGSRSFFVMDENFLLQRKRALDLLALMERYEKSWSLYVFSSANVLTSYSIEQLIRLGVSWVWMGLEGKDSQYHKLDGSDTFSLVRRLQSHGISVLGSSIIGLEEHTPENIDQVIDHAVHHNTEFHQFMLYTPLPGTPLHAEHEAKGTMLDASECSEADAHGQSRFNYRHPHITDGKETEYLLRAFQRDFEVNGPSVLRLVETRLRGWRRYKDHPDRRVRRRYAGQARELSVTMAAGLWAGRRWFRDNPRVFTRLDQALRRVYRTFGLKPRLLAPLLGRVVYARLHKEDERLRQGHTYEPPTFYEKNAAARLITA